MFKENTMPIDQFSDRSFKQLYQLLQEHPGIEEHIKTAQIDVEENEKVSSWAFAWPEERMFRIDTPAHASLSRLYMEKQAGIPDIVKQRCDNALEIYGVKLPLTEKTASAPDPDEYLLPERKRYRVTDKGSVKLAAEALLTNQGRLDPISRTRACVNLVKKASDHNEVLPNGIYKMAGVTMSYLPTMRTWLEARAAAAPTTLLKTAYQKLADSMLRREQYVSDRDELVKVAGVIQELDQAAGLTHWYGRRLPDPVQTVFNTDKIAEEMLDAGGTQIPLSTLEALPAETFEDVFGPEIAGDFTQGGDIDTQQLKMLWDSIPLDLKQALAAQLGL